MVRLWTMRDKLGQIRSPKALVTAIARNMAADRLRQKRTITLEGLAVADEQTATPDQRIETKEDETWLEKQLLALPSTEHQVLYMRQVERKTNDEIASILCIAEASVPTLLARARRRLLEEIKKRRL